MIVADRQTLNTVDFCAPACVDEVTCDEAIVVASGLGQIWRTGPRIQASLVPEDFVQLAIVCMAADNVDTFVRHVDQAAPVATLKDRLSLFDLDRKALRQAREQKPLIYFFTIGKQALSVSNGGELQVLKHFDALDSRSLHVVDPNLVRPVSAFDEEEITSRQRVSWLSSAQRNIIHVAIERLPLQELLPGQKMRDFRAHAEAHVDSSG